jgi:RND family efflux transporter MFP subunit
VRISTGGSSTYLNNTRKDLTLIFENWREKVNSLDTSDDLTVHLNEAEQDTRTLIQMVDVLIAAVSEADSDDTLDDEPLSSYSSDLTAARATLNGVLTTLASAEENLNRARIAGTQNTDVSLANAQVKQALGALRSAEANYEKTIFRSPISGTVNSLQVNVGDFISAFTQVAEIANNDALQISIFAGESDLAQFSLGKSVTINSSVKGTVTSIAPAVDPMTQKTEVKIAAESAELTNGSTVTIKVETLHGSDENEPMKVPLTALRFTAEDGFIFTVENSKLVAHPVVIGDILGSLVVIESGVNSDTVFVLDARGLTPGQQVEAIRK